MTLACNVDGNPPPEIVWLHEKENKVRRDGGKREGEIRSTGMIKEMMRGRRWVRLVV